MARSVPLTALLIKLGAASLTGTVALLAFRRHLRREAILSLRRDIRNSLLHIATDHRRRPPAVLVMGFRAHGKSSFVNTACRVLAGEDGPLLVRAEAAPPGSTSSAGTGHRVFHVAVRDPDANRVMEAEVDEDEAAAAAAAVDLLDAPDLPEAGRLTRADVEVALSCSSLAPECAVLVLRCVWSCRAALSKLPEIAGVVRERGLHLVVVLTHKKSFKTMKQAEMLRKEVASTARTDCVYLIENYTAGGAGSIRNPIAFKNNFDTHSNALAIIRQCIESVRMHRSHQLTKSTTLPSKIKNNNTLSAREE